MEKLELIIQLDKFGLALKTYSDNEWVIGTSRFANIMMGFDPTVTVDQYKGNVHFKIINAPLFTGKQIIGASEIINEFLMTPLEKRKLEGATE